MRIPRLFVPLPLAAGAHLQLDEASAHHVRDVLRLKADAPVILFNGEGGEFSAVLTAVERKSVCVRIGAHDPREAESNLSIHFGLGIARGERMDFAVQKAVELGVAAITPLLTERCVVQLKGERKEHKRRHWQKVAQSAAEQCGRNRIPPVGAPQQLMDWLWDQPGLRLFLDTRGEPALGRIAPEPVRITLLSGPEGGFSDQERASAREAGFIAVRMGPRILRAETASLATLAAVQTLWGDFG